MKVLVILSCAFALASCYDVYSNGYSGIYGGGLNGGFGGGFQGQQVQQQLQQLQQIQQQQQQQQQLQQIQQQQQQQFQQLQQLQQQQQPRYNGPQAIPGPNGVPLDTPEVSQAKGAHLAALAAAGGQIGYQGYGGSYGAVSPILQSASPIAQLLASPAPGAPLDTPEVQAAKVAHFNAVAQAAARNGVPHLRRRRSIGGGFSGGQGGFQQGGFQQGGFQQGGFQQGGFQGGFQGGLQGLQGGFQGGNNGGQFYPGPQHFPILTNRGVPVETPEVRAAKAYHFQAYVDAAQRAALSGPGQSGQWNGPVHIPVIGPNGVPIEPQEVQQARAAHLSALSSGGSLYSTAGGSYAPIFGGSYQQQIQIGPNGQPLDTPEVQAAKAAHFQALSRAYAQAY